MSGDRETQAHRIAHLARRRHPASAAKVITTGLATSGFLGTVGLLAVHGQAPATSAPAAPAAPLSAGKAVVGQAPIVVTDTVHRTVYVDEFGNPVAPPSTPNPASAASTVEIERRTGGLIHATAGTAAPAVASTAPPAGLDSTLPSVPVDSVAGSIVPAATSATTHSTTHPASNPVPTNPAAPPPVEVQTPAPTTGTVAVDPAATAPAPVATDPPATTAAPVVTEPPPTAPPVTAPPETAPPPPPTTAAPPPPTTAPAPPACQGTQCP